MFAFYFDQHDEIAFKSISTLCKTETKHNLTHRCIYPLAKENPYILRAEINLFCIYIMLQPTLDGKSHCKCTRTHTQGTH